MEKAVGAGSVTHYFVENAGSMGAPRLYGDANGDYPDNHVRFAVLARAALEISRHLFHAQVFHAMTGRLSGAGLFARHAGGGPGVRRCEDSADDPQSGLSGAFRSAWRRSGWGASLNPSQMEFWGRVNFLKAGIVFSDAINTVSRKYAEEIQTPEYGFGLDGLLRERTRCLERDPEWRRLCAVESGERSLSCGAIFAEDLAGSASASGRCWRDGTAGTHDRPAAAGDCLALRDAERVRPDWRGGARSIFERDVWLVALGNGEAALRGDVPQLGAIFPIRWR